MTARAGRVAGVPLNAGRLGQDVLGPIVAEFCLRLWTIGSLLEKPQDTALLFCARGGLRLQLAYERFLSATALPSSIHVAPLMVSRAVAVRGSLVRSHRKGLEELLPAAATALRHEFGGRTVAEAASSIFGVPTGEGQAVWSTPVTAPGLAALMRSPDGAGAVAALEEQEQLFGTHLHTALGGRGLAVLVDTGFFGTTRELLAEGHPEVDIASVLLGRGFREGYDTQGRRTFGVLVEATDYVPFLRRTSLLRHWHFVEWLFEPELPSVRTFAREGDRVRSNLETPGWEQQIPPAAGSVFEGVLTYLDALSPGPAERIARDSQVAWSRLQRAIVWPRRSTAEAMRVGRRTHDFGRDDGWEGRPWRGPVTALRGSTMWREGEIAGSGSAWHWPLLTAVNSAYAARFVGRRVKARASRPAGSGPSPGDGRSSWRATA